MKTTALLTPLVLSSLAPRDKEYTLHDAGCAGLALRVQPSGAISWVCWHRAAGKTRRITLGRLGDMDVVAARAAYHARLGQDPENGGSGSAARPATSSGSAFPSASPPGNTLTFATLVTTFLAAKRGVYAASTLSALGAYLDTQLLPAFGARLVTQITVPEVAAWFHLYSRTRPGGANQALGHLRTILNWGRDTGHLPERFANPTAPLRINPRRARGRMLSSDQLRRLAAVLDAATAQQQGAADAIRLMLLTGCRSGEILRLRWDEVHKDRLTLGRTKTGPRVVDLGEAASRHLAYLRRRRCSDHVFPAQRTDKPHRTSVDHAWQSFKRRADLPADLRLHDLRHTYASHAILAGETLYITGKLLGHHSPHSTGRYAHLGDSHLARAADKVAEGVERLMGG